MILPMMGFFFMLMLFGAVGSLATIIDNHAARKAPIPFAMFFSGLGVWVLVIIVGLLGSYVSPGFGDAAAFLVAPLVGSIGGAVFGYWLGLKRRERAPRGD